MVCLGLEPWGGRLEGTDESKNGPFSASFSLFSSFQQFKGKMFIIKFC